MPPSLRARFRLALLLLDNADSVGRSLAAAARVDKELRLAPVHAVPGEVQAATAAAPATAAGSVGRPFFCKLDNAHS